MPLDLALLRARIEAELAHIESDTAQANLSAGTVELDQQSTGRLSRMDALQQQAMAIELRQRAALRQRKLVAALARMDAGTYGVCCECGDILEPERLNADAATVFCMPCLLERSDDSRLR